LSCRYPSPDGEEITEFRRPRTTGADDPTAGRRPAGCQPMSILSPSRSSFRTAPDSAGRVDEQGTLARTERAGLRRPEPWKARDGPHGLNDARRHLGDGICDTRLARSVSSRESSGSCKPAFPPTSIGSPSGLVVMSE